MKLALQLYTVRDCCKTGEELLQTLRAVKALGYEGVEFAGFSGLSAEEVKAALDEIGLTVVSCHESLDRLEKDIDEVLAFCHTIGNHNLACAYAPTGDLADMEALERVLKKAQARAGRYGIRVLYHNHSHEFVPIEDVFPLDRIKQYCPLELDSYWVFNSKQDAPAYIRDNADSIGLLHLKDGGLDSNPCAIGEGANDIQGIIDAAKEIGLKWLIVENDNPVPDGLSDVTRSIQSLQARYRF